MSLTPTQSMSAPRACAARNTLRPMRPKPLMPAVKAMSGSPFLRVLCAGPESIRRLGAVRWLVHVSVDDLDHEVASCLVFPRKMLGYDHRAVAAPGAADRDGEVGFPLLLVRGQQVVEQRREPGVELADAVGALHVADDVGVEPCLLAQLGLVMRVREEAHGEGEVGVARRAVLEAEGHERHGELAGTPLRE